MASGWRRGIGSKSGSRKTMEEGLVQAQVDQGAREVCKGCPRWGTIEGIMCLFLKRRGESKDKSCPQTSEGLSHESEVSPFLHSSEGQNQDQWVRSRESRFPSDKGYWLKMEHPSWWGQWPLYHWRYTAEASSQGCKVQGTEISLCDQIDLDPNPLSSAYYLRCLGHFTFLSLISSPLNSHLIGLSWKFGALKYIKHPASCLAQKRYSINVSDNDDGDDSDDGDDDDSDDDEIAMMR